MAKPKQNPAPSDPWDEAFLRVEAYLHAWKVEPRSLIAETATAICKKARQLAETRPGAHPVSLAMQALETTLSERFREVYPEIPALDHHQRAKGRVALLISQSAPLLARQLLTDQPCPPALSETLRESHLQSGPELRLSKMAPAPIEFGFGDNDEAVPSAPRWLPNPALIVALLVVSAIGGALAAAH